MHLLSKANHHLSSNLSCIFKKDASVFIDSIKAGPSCIVSLPAKVAITRKFSLIFPENKQVTLLKIYFFNISSLFVLALEIKQAAFKCSI